jgi:hypothetical protein
MLKYCKRSLVFPIRTYFANPYLQSSISMKNSSKTEVNFIFYQVFLSCQDLDFPSHHDKRSLQNNVDCSDSIKCADADNFPRHITKSNRQLVFRQARRIKVRKNLARPFVRSLSNEILEFPNKGKTVRVFSFTQRLSKLGFETCTYMA